MITQCNTVRTPQIQPPPPPILGHGTHVEWQWQKRSQQQKRIKTGFIHGSYAAQVEEGPPPKAKRSGN
jgi:hypothetical protein